jgi:pimeloyl-ACP methyl ester carboxylesterase
MLVRSRDGVEISVQKSGSGLALLLIHGSMLNGALAWGRVLPQFAEHFTVYALDRRGRAPSGDAKEYSLSTEADDIAAVVEAIGQPATILSHSYGALATLEALDRLTRIVQLILYEPPVTLGPSGPESEKLVASMERALEAGDRGQVVTIFLRDQVGIPAERLSGFQSSPIWPLVLPHASTLPREARSVNTYRSWDERLAKWKTPTTLLLGSETTGVLREGTMYLSRAIPACRLVVLEGQGHGAPLDAPDYFVAKVLEVALPATPSRS